jgi:hypothetical protein
MEVWMTPGISGSPNESHFITCHRPAKTPKHRSKATPGVVIDILPAEPPSQDDFKRARDLLRKRTDALILDLAKRYLASTASELTTALDAMDRLAEFEKMQRS